VPPPFSTLAGVVRREESRGVTYAFRASMYDRFKEKAQFGKKIKVQQGGFDMGRMIGNRLTFTKAEFTPPTDPMLHIEQALNCDGECGNSLISDDGYAEVLPPHFHLVESQPGAWTRPYPIDSL